MMSKKTYKQMLVSFFVLGVYKYVILWQNGGVL